MSGTSDFTYDATGQLTDVDHTHISDEEYTYDENGNRTVSGYTTGTGNRLTSDGTFNYTYDDNGNRITKTRISSATVDDKTVEYEWDHRNRLTSIVTKNNSSVVTKEVEYEYDVFDRRVSKTVDADGAGAGSAVTSRFVYEGSDILVVTDVSGDVTHRLLHGPAVDQALAIEEDSTGDILWGLTDHLGSVRDIVDDDGVVQNHIVYDSFGNVVSETASAVDYLFGFTGRERDEESGLNYHRARYLDMATGRWLSDDPIGFAAGDTNIQRYVGNDPLNSRDPSGLTELSVSIDIDDDIMWTGDTPAQRSSVFDAFFPFAASLDDLNDSLGQRIFLHELNDYVQGTTNNAAWVSSFGYSDSFGITDTSRYTGTAWDRQRIAFTFAREATVGLATAGAGNAVSVGGRSVLYAGRAYEVYGVGEGVYSTGQSIAEGDVSGTLISGGLTIVAGVGLRGSFNAPKSLETLRDEARRVVLILKSSRQRPMVTILRLTLLTVGCRISLAY